MQTFIWKCYNFDICKGPERGDSPKLQLFLLSLCEPVRIKSQIIKKKRCFQSKKDDASTKFFFVNDPAHNNFSCIFSFYYYAMLYYLSSLCTWMVFVLLLCSLAVVLVRFTAILPEIRTANMKNPYIKLELKLFDIS